MQSGDGRKPKDIFFAVYVPPSLGGIAGDGDSQSEPVGGVFENMAAAIELVKSHRDRGARFKSFSTSEEARNFASGVSEVGAGPISGGGDCYQTPAAEENPPAFSSLSRPQLSGLKSAIEKGNFEKFSQLVGENPRYLINYSADTPAVIFEGCRYNALHVAARSGNFQAAQLVLALITNEQYLSRLYSDEGANERAVSNRKKFLLDLYLNTPDKSMNETPLHFASKLGHVEIVRLLSGFRECQRKLVNKQGETAAQIACSRATGLAPGAELEAVRNEIYELLGDKPSVCYVALYRPQDYSDEPILMPPCKDFPESTLEQVERNVGINSPAFINPKYCLAAYAGPISPSKGDELHRQWTSTGPHCAMELLGSAHIKRSDLHKGVERLGRHLAEKLECEWTEYWPFLGCFCNFSTDQGLGLLEEYLEKKETGPAGDVIDEQLTKMAGVGVLKPVQDFASPVACSGAKRFQEFFQDSVFGSPHPNSASNDTVKSKLVFDGISADSEAQSSLPSMTSEMMEDDVFFEDCSSDPYWPEKQTHFVDQSEMSDLAEKFGGLCLSSISALQLAAEISENHPGEITCKSREDGEDSLMRDDTSDQEESFATPPSTPPATYLVGGGPTKMDFDVFVALEQVWAGRENDLTGKFPKVGKWMKIMKFFSPQDRKEWPGIDSPRAKKVPLKKAAEGLKSPLAF